MKIEVELGEMDESKDGSYLSCENENGDSKTFELRLLVKPKVEVNFQNLPSSVKVGDVLSAQCSASGGLPKVNLKWLLPNGEQKFSKIEENGKTLISRINYTVDAQTDGKSIKCLVDQFGTTDYFSLPPISVSFPPTNVVYQLGTRLQMPLSTVFVSTRGGHNLYILYPVVGTYRGNLVIFRKVNCYLIVLKLRMYHTL